MANRGVVSADRGIVWLTEVLCGWQRCCVADRSVVWHDRGGVCRDRGGVWLTGVLCGMARPCVADRGVVWHDRRCYVA